MSILLSINELILTNRLKKIQKEKGIIYAVDFDAGYITNLLLKIKKQHKLNLILDCFTTKNSNLYSLDKDQIIYQRTLLTCSDASFNKMLGNKIYNKLYMVKSQQNPNKRMTNAFFEIIDGDLRNHYDFVFITGPNSNGRDLSFLHIKDRVKTGSFILLNELDKYTSLETMDRFFETKEIFRNILPQDRIGFFEIN